MFMGRSGRRKGIRMGLVAGEESVKKGRSILADSHLETLPLPGQRAAGTERLEEPGFCLQSTHADLLAWRETGDSRCHLTAILSETCQEDASTYSV